MTRFFDLSPYLGPHQDCAVALMPDYHVEGETLFFCGYPERVLTIEQSAILKQCSGSGYKIKIQEIYDEKASTNFLLGLAALGYLALIPCRNPPHKERPRILIISPHMDDAFLSLGGLISGYSTAIDFQIIAIFGNDPWCTFHDRFRLQKRHLNALRKREDKFSAWMCNCRIQIWDFVSSPQRGHQIWNGEYDPILDDDVKQKILNKIESFITKNKIDVVLWPLGVGGHTDHRLVSSIPRELTSKHLCKFSFYEDLPYSAFDFHWQTWPPSNVMSSMTPFYIPIETSLNYKRHILDVYRSQLVPNETYLICEYSKPHKMNTGIPDIDCEHRNSVFSKGTAYERLWLPRTLTVNMKNLLRKSLD